MILTPQPWMHAPSLVSLYGLLNRDGARTRLAGGCVRDAVIGRPIRDIDLATDLEPGEVTARCRAAGLKTVDTGLDHGTITVVTDGTGYEVTTLRRDVETDGRRAVVEFTTDWQADAARRDFTLNALYMDLDGRIDDWFGGIEDALAGRIRFVGDPEDRLHEDYLRLLRFFRFQATHGRGDPDPQAYQACIRVADRLERLSVERIQHEVMRLLAAPDPAPVWRSMMEGGVTAHLPVTLDQIDALNALVSLEPQHGLTGDPLRRLLALAGPAADAADLATGLRLSNASRTRLEAAQTLSHQAPPEPAAIDALLYRNGAQAVTDAGLLALARHGGGAGWKAAVTRARTWERPAFPISGADLRQLGLAQGPALGEVLKQVEGWWIAEGFAPDRAHCLEKAKGLI